MTKEEFKEYRKRYYEENKEKFKEINKQYYEKNKEKLGEKRKEYRKKYYRENKEKALEYRKRYYEENKEKAREYQRKYRLKMGMKPRVPQEDVIEIETTITNEEVLEKQKAIKKMEDDIKKRKIALPKVKKPTRRRRRATKKTKKKEPFKVEVSKPILLLDDRDERDVFIYRLKQCRTAKELYNRFYSIYDPESFAQMLELVKTKPKEK